MNNNNNNNVNKTNIQQMSKSAPVSRGNSQAIVNLSYNMPHQFKKHNEDYNKDESNNNNNEGSYSTKRNVINASMPNQSQQQQEQQMQQPNLYTYNAGRAMSYTSGKAQSRKRVLLSDATNEMY